MKIRLSNLFWLIGIFALLTAWRLDHIRLKAANEKLNLECADMFERLPAINTSSSWEQVRVLILAKQFVNPKDPAARKSFADQVKKVNSASN